MKKFEPSKCYAFDFECTSREPSEVYLCAVARLSKLQKKHVRVFHTIGQTVEYIFTRGKGSKFYAHNLKYDISFILCYLFQHHEGEFEVEKAIIQDMTKSVVTMTIRFMGNSITFIDTVPIFSAPLAQVLKAFTDMEKGETPLFDYPEDVVVTPEIIDYCITDALGLAKSIIKRLEYGQGSLTTASDAFKTFKLMVNEESKGRFDRFYRPLEPEIDAFIRPAYRGGFTYLNPDYQGKMLKGVSVIDVNSMYPDKMYNELLPHSEPKFVNSGAVVTNATYQLGIQIFSIKSAHLKDGFTPFLSTSNTLMHAANYLSEIDENLPLEKRTFSLTLQEFELFKESYSYEELELQGGFLFKARRDMFRKYIDKYWQLKGDKNATIKTIGKLFLNSLYGKFAEGMEKNSYKPYYDDGIKWQLTETETRPCGYLPAGVFITSYARCFLLNSINRIGVHNFVYCDTDSIHFFDDGECAMSLDMHPSRLGAWDFENYFERAYYVRSKRYCGEYINKDSGEVSLKMACAGIKTNALKEQILRIEDFKEGRPIKTIEFKQGVNGQHVRDKTIKI